MLLIVFFFVFRATERGLNINGFPTSLTSSAGFIVSGIDGSADRLGGGKLSPPGAASALLELFEGSSSRLKPFSALVLRLIMGRAWLLEGLLSVAFAAFFGGGRKELKPEKRPPPAPVRARFAGGPSPFDAPSSLEEAAWGRLTMILPGFDRSTTFWNAGFFGAGLTAGFGASTSGSDSDSE